MVYFYCVRNFQEDNECRLTPAGADSEPLSTLNNRPA